MKAAARSQNPASWLTVWCFLSSSLPPSPTFSSTLCYPLSIKGRVARTETCMVGWMDIFY